MTRYIYFLFIFLLSFSQTLAQMDRMGTLKMKNEESFKGSLVSLDHDANEILWQLMEKEKPKKFILKAVKSITFSKSLIIPATKFQVNLIDGGRILATDFQFDKDTVSVNTDFVGKLQIHRKSIYTIDPFFREIINIYSRLNSIEKWQQYGSKKWTYQNNYLIAPNNSIATISQKLRFEDRVKISFSLKWSGNLDLTVGLFANKPGPTASDEINVSLNINGMQIRRGAKPIYNYRFNFSRVKTVQFAIALDKPSNRIPFYINNRRITAIRYNLRNWNGQWLKFSSTKTSTGMKISNIKVEELNKKKRTPPFQNLTTDKNDVISFKSTEQYSGKCLSAKNSILNFKPLYADSFEIPYKLIKAVRFAGTMAKNNDTNCIFTLRNKNLLYLNLLKADNKTAEIQSSAFGKAKINLDFCHKIDFQ